MSKAALNLKIVPSSTAKPRKRWQGEDNAFFHLSQMRVGLRLTCMGRIDHGATWVVKDLRCYGKGDRTGPGRAAPALKHLYDLVVLRRIGSNEIRTKTFATLSYSAIWQIARR